MGEEIIKVLKSFIAFGNLDNVNNTNDSTITVE